MDIGYIWDEDKYHLVQQKHQVSFHEVVSALDDPQAQERVVEYEDSLRYELIGRSAAGRRLLVVYADTDPPYIRIITAFDAPKEWPHE